MIDLEAVNYLNETSITEVVPSDISMALGIIFILIGLYIFYTIVSYNNIENKKLKRFGS
jgi:hypothetical protein